MSIDEFLNKLSRLRHKGSKKKVKWMFDTSGTIRSVVGSSLCPSTYKHCPITAVFKAEQGISLGLFNAPLAAYDLNLENSRLILNAADNFNILDPKVRDLRQKLLKACGITEGRVTT